MLKISSLTVKTKEDKTILQDINLEFKTGKIYAISGQNGSGKSTLAQVIIGNPEYILDPKSELICNPVTATTVSLQGNEKLAMNDLSPNAEASENSTTALLPSNMATQGCHNSIPQPINLTNLTPDQRSQLGIFVSMQYPTEVTGVNLLGYLKLIIEINRKARNLDKLTAKQTLDLIHSKLELIGWSKEILKRNLNEGMSGGERKKSEILQMLLLDPQLIILDEIDSGLDKQALEIIVEIIKNFMTKDKILIVITHQQKILDLLQPDEIVYLKDGKIV
jgi:Fe-S cluster assembly ATP-binding protein